MKEYANFDLYLPESGSALSEELVWRWYCNVTVELQDSFLDKTQHDKLYEYYTESGLLRSWRRYYFRHHFVRTFSEVITFLIEKNEKKPVILDLGCGLGTQSLALAMLGAKVIAIDMDKSALDILRARKEFYERRSGRALDIQIYESNIFEFNYASIAPIDSLYSLFAFNMMQPSSKLIDILLPYLAPDARIAILDGNNRSWAARYLPWRRRAVWSPMEFHHELTKRRFQVVMHESGAVLPPLLWHFIPHKVGAALDHLLGQNWFFPISHLIFAERVIEKASFV